MKRKLDGGEEGKPVQSKRERIVLASYTHNSYSLFLSYT